MRKTLHPERPAVYSITCKDPKINDMYIGSCNNFNNRYKDHKYGSTHDIPRKVNQMLLYKFIRNNGGWSNWICKPEEFLARNGSIDKRKELEQIYIDLLEPSLNRVRAIGKDLVRKKKYDLNYNTLKEFCPVCKTLMSKKSVKRHIGRKHKQFLNVKF